MLGLAAALVLQVTRVDLLPPGPGNPRNSEGDFLPLRDGRLLFAYSKFSGGNADDAAATPATAASRGASATSFWSAARAA
jgi:hypothetical protein